MRVKVAEVSEHVTIKSGCRVWFLSSGEYGWLYGRQGTGSDLCPSNSTDLQCGEWLGRDEGFEGCGEGGREPILENHLGDIYSIKEYF